jgi:hypothetical protein
MTMTKEEGKIKLFKIVEEEIKNSGWLIFNKRNIELAITRILEPYEKKANLPLPEKLKVCGITIDKQGITFEKGLTEWKEICATGIKTEITYDGNSEENIYEKHLMIIFQSGKAIQYPLLCDITNLHGLLGHFIELYKCEYDKLYQNQT